MIATPDREKLLTRAAILSVIAALLHGLVTGEHFDEWWGYGVFFLISACAQGVFGAIPFLSRMMEGQSVLVTWSDARFRAYCWSGIVGNAAIIAMYVVSRTIGIPFFGPEAGTVEKVGFVDVVSKATELALIVCLVLLLRSSSPTRSAATPDAR